MNNWSKFLSLIILFDNKRTKNDLAISFSARQKQCFLIWMLPSGVAGNILIYYKSVITLSQACFKALKSLKLGGLFTIKGFF